MARSAPLGSRPIAPFVAMPFVTFVANLVPRIVEAC